MNYYNTLSTEARTNVTNVINREDINEMIVLVRQDYKNYQIASIDLKRDYRLIMDAIYSCLSTVNSLENKIEASNRLSYFLKYIKKCSGVDMKPTIYNGTLGVVKREMPKIKSLFLSNTHNKKYKFNMFND